MSLRVVSVGECTIDHYLSQGRQFVGGISLNFAVQAKRSGADVVSFVSCAGEDAASRILAALEKEGVDGSHVSRKMGNTARQDILLGGSGERVFPPGGYAPGVLDGFLLAPSDLEFVQRHDILASAFFRQAEPVFRQALEVPFEGWRVADFLDLSDYGHDIAILERLSERLTIAFVSGDLALVERLRPLSRSSRCTIVVTLGAGGSAALLKGEPLFQPSIEVSRTVDSTGCGDAFQAAFTVAYWHTREPAPALKAGALQAAKVIQHLGAIQQ